MDIDRSWFLPERDPPLSNFHLAEAHEAWASFGPPPFGGLQDAQLARRYRGKRIVSTARAAGRKIGVVETGFQVPLRRRTGPSSFAAGR